MNSNIPLTYLREVIAVAPILVPEDVLSRGSQHNLRTDSHRHVRDAEYRRNKAKQREGLNKTQLAV